jgi:hypothetical protein
MSTNHNGLTDRPNQLAKVTKVGTLKEWFNTAAFAAPGYGFYGNASNGTIRGPGYTSANVSVYKSFPIYDRLNFQIRAEAFNVLNHPNFNGLSTGVGSGNYGQLTSAGDPRIMEFAGRLFF